MMDNNFNFFNVSKYRHLAIYDLDSCIAFSLPTEPTKPDAFSLFPTLTDTTQCVKMSDLAMSFRCNVKAPQRYLRRLRYRHWGRIFKFRHLVKHSKL